MYINYNLKIFQYIVYNSLLNTCTIIYIYIYLFGSYDPLEFKINKYLFNTSYFR